MSSKWIISNVESFIPTGTGSGGDYHRQGSDHWILGYISTPMSQYEEYRKTRTSFGIDVLGSCFVQITTEDGSVGYATGFGGHPACFLIEQHFKRFLIGQDCRDINKMWDQMFKASMYYGRKGLPLAAISVVDLALWDLVGKIRGESVSKMIGGHTKKEIPLYLTGPKPPVAKKMGFWGGKVPLPYSPAEGQEGLRKNVEYLKAHRKSVGDNFPIMVDCWMSLNVQYALELASTCIKEGVDIYWWEEVLHPDDFDGHALLKKHLPNVRWTTGEHEYTKYGFRKLIEGRNIDILQPDVMWLGGMTELIKVASMAAAYDLPVVPHGSGPYSFHGVVSFPNSHFCEYIANSPDGEAVYPSFGDLFLDEPLPLNGKITLEDKPGFGMTLNPKAQLAPARIAMGLDLPPEVKAVPEKKE